MTLTFQQLLLAYEVLQRVMDHRFPAGRQQTAYRLNKIRKTLVGEYEFFQQQRKQLIEELGAARKATPRELLNGADGTVWEVLKDSSNWNEFSTRMKEVLDIQVNVADVKVRLDELDTVDLSARDVEALEPFLEMSEELKT